MSKNIGFHIEILVNNNFKKEIIETSVIEKEYGIIINTTFKIRDIKNVNLDYLRKMIDNDKDLSKSDTLNIDIIKPVAYWIVVYVMDDQDIKKSDLHKYAIKETIFSGLEYYKFKSGFGIDDKYMYDENHKINKFINYLYNKIYTYAILIPSL